jgi:hypothetical protein
LSRILPFFLCAKMIAWLHRRRRRRALRYIISRRMFMSFRSTRARETI